MKKQIIMLLAAAALVGCNRADNEVNEPAGAARPMERSTTNTNSLSDPSGAGVQQGQQGQSGTQSDSSSSSSQSSDTSSGAAGAGTSPQQNP